MKTNTILYISNILPVQSETFVYREIFALRACGAHVLTASVHVPEKNLGNPDLDLLAAAAIPIYGSGSLKLILDAVLDTICHPISALKVISLAFRDSILGEDIKGIRRLKVFVHAISALALAQRVRHLGIQHIHAHMAHVPTSIAMYTARQLNLSFSFTGHANDLFPNRTLLKEKIKRSLFVSCISHWHREFYTSIYPKDSSRLPIIRCGVDTSKEVYKPAVHGEVLKILSVGRLVSKKGFDILLEAVGIIANREKDKIELTIVGTGPEENHLRAQVERLPSSAKVIMLGSLDNNHVMELMTLCQLFILPLRISAEGDRDGIPVVLMEAMARGRCVVAGDLVTIRELVENNISGYLVPLGDVNAIVCIIEQLASDRSLLDTLGARARERIIEEFDVNTNASILLKTIRMAGICV